MKKLFSFTLFMVIVILALIARSTASAKAMDNPRMGSVNQSR